MDRRLFIGAIGGASALGFGLDLGLGDASRADTTVTSAEPGDMTMGSPKARVTVIEYASASCPHCARFNNDVFPAFKAKYIDTGRVFYVFREFLTPPVEVAAAGFLVARCAGQGKYFGVVDAFFHAQSGIYQSGDLKTPLLKIAADAGLDEKAVDACMGDQAAVKALNERVERYVNRDGVQSTPTFLVAGQRLTGEQSLDALDAAIVAAEAKAPPPPAAPTHHHRRHAQG
jgi:protein-disulfide isomerase